MKLEIKDKRPSSFLTSGGQYCQRCMIFQKIMDLVTWDIVRPSQNWFIIFVNTLLTAHHDLRTHKTKAYDKWMDEVMAKYLYMHKYRIMTQKYWINYNFWCLLGYRYYPWQSSKLNWGINISDMKVWSKNSLNNAHDLLNLRALKISMLYQIILFNVWDIFCGLLRWSLKFHTNYLTHTWKDVYAYCLLYSNRNIYSLLD